MAHFYLQYHSAFDGAQQLLANLVADEARLDKPRSSPRVIANRLQTIVKDAMPILVENGWNKAPVLGDATIRGDTQSLTVICIDEATDLFSPDDRDESSGRYRPSISFRAFRSALRSFSQNKVGTMPVLGLLLDTSSHITDFAPPASTDASQKYPTFHKLLRPIYYLETWDVFASDPPSQGKKPSWLEIACQRNDGNDDSNFLAHGPDGSIDHQVFMARFGRPLWASVVTTATDMATDAKMGDEKDRIFQRALDHIRSLAYDKLTGTTPDNSIALLLYRLQFHVQDHRLAENLVARWMHYFSYVAMDRTWVCTCQPSEPVLALAAAQKLLDHKTRCRAFRDFVQMHLHGVLHAGDCGEVVASLLLIFAADAHLDPGHPKTVSLSAFLTTLLGDINNGDDSEWADGEILLTHFNRLRLRGNQSLTAKHLISAFVLGQGFILPQGMAGADLLVPVWLRAEQRMGALLVQVKNRANGTLTKTMCAHARGSMEMAEHALPFLKTTKVFGMYISLRGKPGKDGSPHEWLPSRSGRLPIVVTAGFALSVFPVLKGPKPGGFAASANVEDDIEQILRQLLNNVGQVVLPDDRIEGVDSILYTREPL
ncbi:hypothetical protein CMQ_7588 [Grosmannia clavigera kw1407]|uniref:Uncharacterized protein n=1 Tax=Grosmannia clavigera (strain kw1407 / UAMH 11150) TaxID=655863 RepID=F0XQC9_GROCL|nr:uncharacterized protein CMQ_7588 [Grosmannia clavigera kw1407]EFX00586.1 hypothetical protein CMQ_7588 [Grosmannia clavigera kw1407]